MKKYVWIIVVMCFFAVTGCGYFEGYIDIARYKGISKEYHDFLKKWTRDKTIYSEFETKIHISATYKSPEFMKAYQKEYARLYDDIPDHYDEKDKIRDDFDDQYKAFFFYAYLPDREANDFDLQRSIWKIYLIDEAGKNSDPVEIRRISKITPVIEAFYPYVKKYYGNFYQLKFLSNNNEINKILKAENQEIKLVFTSVLGRVELNWD